MNAELPESIIRHRKMQIEIAKRRLGVNPGCQARVIAEHYVAHANIAMNLLELLELEAHAGGGEALWHAVDLMVNQIKENHALDLGIELEWPKKT